MFSGSAQFGAASILGAGGGALAALVAAVLLNSRFLPMGVAVAPELRGGAVRRAVEGQATVDASFALASRDGGGDSRARLTRDRARSATAPPHRQPAVILPAR